MDGAHDQAGTRGINCRAFGIQGFSPVFAAIDTGKPAALAIQKGEAGHFHALPEYFKMVDFSNGGIGRRHAKKLAHLVKIDD